MREIRKIHEALLAQHFEDVDRLANKITDAAEKVERATATLTAVCGTPRPGRVSQNPPDRNAFAARSAWGQGLVVATIMAGVMTSAGVAAWVSRTQPMHTPEQERAAKIGNAIVQAWPTFDPATQRRMWNALTPEAQEALARSANRR
ncbi:hypothetical protein [Cupriavidus nantongensis]|uniref:Uncharacterized protein n=1 Tax=Cupriavidus nantongensis TaxID=1796606 RepID=A0A142JKJ2_9BURK|nr:hypothetical protein [Cupriavidus nantongensis]AMR78604.1 hypothetical protein A2G96_13105 [Cupriavidus nantongensis]